MKIFTKYLLLAFFSAGLVSCNMTKNSVDVVVSNTSDVLRKEVVSIEKTSLDPFINGRELANFLVCEKGDSTYLVSQWVDNNMDSIPDELLFVAHVKPHAAKAYEIIYVENGASLQPKPKNVAYSRFVPERTDDYTWENDKVAFRTYGPEAQRMVEENIPGGTLSSGIDLWLKRVPYSIIDKWYAGYLNDPMFYHSDRGEGYDPYHVGKSRGTGGIGIWKNDSLFTSKNFIGYRTIASGPLRTIFELDYAPWSQYNVQETKRISLDLGSNFSKFEISLSSDTEVPNFTVGITLHEKEGKEKLEPEQGIFRHWEAIDTSFVGEGIVLDPSLIEKAFAYDSETPDQSQILIVTHPKNKKLTYYAGFAWTRSNQVSSVSDWDSMLQKQAIMIANALKVEIK